MIYDLFVSFGIPVSICVVLPVLIIWLLTRSRKHMMDKKVEFMIKCVENGVEVDPNIFENGKRQSAGLKKALLNRLAAGVICVIAGAAIMVISFISDMEWIYGPLTAAFVILAVGVGMLVWYFVGVKFLKEEINAEQEINVKQMQQ